MHSLFVLSRHTIIYITKLVILFLITLANKGKKQSLPNEGLPRRQGSEQFYIHLYTCTDPFIHLLGSSLIQWMIARINGRT